MSRVVDDRALTIIAVTIISIEVLHCVTTIHVVICFNFTLIADPLEVVYLREQALNFYFTLTDI